MDVWLIEQVQGYKQTFVEQVLPIKVKGVAMLTKMKNVNEAISKVTSNLAHVNFMI